MELIQIIAVAVGGGGIAWATWFANNWWKSRDSRRADAADKREDSAENREAQKELRDQADWLVSHFERTAKNIEEQLQQALVKLDEQTDACAKCRTHFVAAIALWDNFITEARDRLHELDEDIAKTDREFQALAQEHNQEMARSMFEREAAQENRK